MVDDSSRVRGRMRAASGMLAARRLARDSSNRSDMKFLMDKALAAELHCKIIVADGPVEAIGNWENRGGNTWA